MLALLALIIGIGSALISPVFQSGVKASTGPVALLPLNRTHDEAWSHQGLTFGGLIHLGLGTQAVMEALDACAEHLRNVIKNDTQGEVAAIIIEPMQGTAGNVIPPEGFLRAVQQIAKEAGALLIADEMITGFGRTGLMWGSEHDGVVPDIMTVGKGVGGGFPLSAVISTDDLTNRKPWSNPSASSSSYGANPLAAAAGLAALEIILKEDLVKNADRVGAVMLTRLEALKEKYRCVGEVRGRGLMLGMELVKDRGTKEPLGKDVTQALYKECLRRGLAAMTYSPTVRINPPLVIREEEALNGLAILDEALGAIVREYRLQ